MGPGCTLGEKCQISGTGKHPAGLSLIARNTFIPVVQPILIRRAPVGSVLIHKMKSCLALRGIAKLARFLIFIMSKTIPGQMISPMKDCRYEAMESYPIALRMGLSPPGALDHLANAYEMRIFL